MPTELELDAARQRERAASALEGIAEGLREMAAQQERYRRAFAGLLLSALDHADAGEMPPELRDAVRAALKELLGP